MSGLESANLKITRAGVHLDAINRAIKEATLRPGSYEIIKDADGKDTVNFLISPPPEIAILAGEIVYQARSALDHLAYELVKLNRSRVALPKHWTRNCTFPMCLEIPEKLIKAGHTTPPLPYNCFKDSLPGISEEAFDYIERLQPYRIGAGGHNFIRLIAKLANIDKHRHLHVILPRVAVHQHTEAKGHSLVSTKAGLKQGSVIEAPLSVEIPDTFSTVLKRTFSPYMTFDEDTVGPGPDTLESQHLLGFCVEYLRNRMIPVFERLLKP